MKRNTLHWVELERREYFGLRSTPNDLRWSEHDGQSPAAYRTVRIKANEAETAKRLQGNRRSKHLFALKQALAGFDFCGRQLAECDAEIELRLQALQTPEDPPAQGKKRSRARDAPKFDARAHLFKGCGADLTRIDGVDVTTAMTVIRETGPDMSRFSTVNHFRSWLGLCPGTKISGGKLLGAKPKRTGNRATQALKLAAAALCGSKSALGAFYRRMSARMDKPRAVTAAARKLARLIYIRLT